MPIVYFSDPPANPFKQREWLIEFKNYVLYGTIPGEGGSTSVSANYVNAGPTSGGAAVPTYRLLVAADIPNLDAAKITSGTLNTSRIPSLDTAKITSGTFSAARIPFAAPGAIGSTTPGTGAFTTLSTTGDATVGGNLSVTGTFAFGTAAFTTITTTGLATLNSLIVQGANSGNVTIVSDDDSGVGNVFFKTTDNGTTLRNRFKVEISLSETGSNAGSNLIFTGYDDDGTTGTHYLKFDRAAHTTIIPAVASFLQSMTVTGAATLSSTLTVTGTATLSSTLAVTGNATFSANVQGRYGKMTGTGSTFMDVNGGTSSDKMYRIYASNSLRWEMKSTGTETGTNGGNEFSIVGYENDGTTAINFLNFNREFATVTSSDPRWFFEGGIAGKTLLANYELAGWDFTPGGITYIANSGPGTGGDTTEVIGFVPALFAGIGFNADYHNTTYNSTAIYLTNITSGTPSTPGTVNGWMKVWVKGVVKYIPYYA